MALIFTARSLTAVVPDANPDEQRYEEISVALGDAIAAAVPGWIERLVVERVTAWRGSVTPEVRGAAAEAGEAARDDIVPRVRALLSTDIDEQRTNPLALLRGATVHAHRVLAAEEVPAVVRDEFAERSFPDDIYGLVPAAWTDIDGALHEPGMTWGAAKAFLFKARRRAEGRT